MATAEATRSKRRKELLSFADDEEEEEDITGDFQEQPRKRMVSAHDVLLDDKRLNREAIEQNEHKNSTEKGVERTKEVLGVKKANEENDDTDISFEEKMRRKILQKRKEMGDVPAKNEVEQSTGMILRNSV